jgi:glycosyltransferase involved in cell wall biosynthesis
MSVAGGDCLPTPVRKIRVLAMMESQWVTGPAKNLIAFGRQLQALAPSDLPAVELSVIAFDRPSSPANRFISALNAAGIRTHVIRERHAGDPRVIRQLLALVRSEKPDILQTHNSKSHFLVRLTGLQRRIPWIAFFHGFTSRNARDRFYNRIGWWALRGAPHIVTVCRAFAADLQRSGVPADRISVRHNIVAPFVAPLPSEMAALRNRLAIPADARVVLAVGRLSKEKGHIDLLDAIALIRAARDCAGIRFILVGDGPERAVLQQRSHELGLADCVVFTGHQEDMGIYYGLADAFVLPSHSEGSPNVLLEAMAAGLPIVSTDAGGAAELVSDGNTALVVERQAPQALSHALSALLDDRDLAGRLGKAARCAAREYTPEAYTRSLAGIYQAVADEVSKF